ncbi:DUF397 domain-containing protein [Streptosporangium amethystogenes]|uniref:DUF397 domain-containing protein n=1 Tax=Streptosporangium amethystogenes TaxID=2002 RepID=UPI0037BBE61A
MSQHCPANAVWRKSSLSGSGNNCVEVARVKNRYFVRDSKSLDCSTPTFFPEEGAEVCRHHLANTAWWKSSRSQGTTDNCVEVAFASGLVAVRDSKDPGGAVLSFSSNGWAAFLRCIKAGDFDTPP